MHLHNFMGGSPPLQQFGNAAPQSSSDLQSSSSAAPKAAEPTFIPVPDQEPVHLGKRKRYYDEDSSEDTELDPESYYKSTPVNMAAAVEEFVTKTFRQCLPKRKRLDIAKEYPKPSSSAVAVPKLDHDIKGALGKELPKKEDTQLAKIQAMVLAACAPLANFWSHLVEQEFTGKSDELIPASDVLKVTQDTLALIGNASNYIFQARRTAVINSLSKSRPKLSTFMKEVCKDDLGDTGPELLGPEVRKKITEWANTIDVFNKAISNVDKATSASTVPSTSRSFLSKRPTAKYGGESGGSYTPYSKFRQFKPGYRGNKGNFRGQKKFSAPRRKD